MGNEEVVVKMPDVLKQSMHRDDTCYAMDYLDLTVSDSMEELLADDEVEFCLMSRQQEEFESEVLRSAVKQLNDHAELKKDRGFEDINRSTIHKSKPSTEEPPELELKQLPSYLQYAFLEEGSKLPVIISSDLNKDQKEKLLCVLGQHKKAIAWKMADIKGISPSFCTHKILLEDDAKPVIQP